MTKVTVAMATFNDQSTIDDSIQSIVDQTFTDWELLVVDDASTDNTSSIVRDWSSRDQRIELVRQHSNAGSGAARNRAIQMAAGEYIAVLDADDIALARRLELQAREMDTNRDLAAVASQLAEFGSWGGPELSGWATDDVAVAARQIRYKMPIPHPSTMFRAEVVQSIGGYDEKCRRAQDYALFLKLRKHQVRCLPEVLVHYRTERPVSLRYVRRNQEYADLALKRYRLESDGVDRSMIPTEPKWSPIGEAKALKSWLVRAGRERMAQR